MKKTLTPIAELQVQAAEALNKLYVAMKAANYQMILPIHFYLLAFGIDDTDNGYVFKPNNLVPVDSFKSEEPKDNEPNTIIQYRQKPEFRDITTVKRGLEW